MVAANALTAYNNGASGQGARIAIIDGGVNPALSDFAGRIDASSGDVGGFGRGVSDNEGHGTSVTAVAAAGRNAQQIIGVAFNATILSYNSSDPNSCSPNDGCSHADSAIATGVDAARTNGARVINMSLGGSAPNSQLLSAINRATAAGIVVVISAGNDGGPNPDPFPLGAVNGTSQRGLVVIAGAHDITRSLADFSNQAGSGAANYLVALGDSVRSFDQNGAGGLFSGTSYSAPVISGAVALMASAFPNLSGQQIVDLLLSTADDAGAAGTDAIYGRGILNIGRAFQPQGQMSLAGSGAAVTATGTNSASGAMGDAKGGASVGAIILDGYSRAFAVEFATQLRSAPEERPLGQSLVGTFSTGAAQSGPTSVSITVDRRVAGRPIVGFAQTGMSYDDAREARVVSGAAVSRLTPDTAIAFGFSESGRALQQRLVGAEQNAFLVARDPLARAGFFADAGDSVGVRQDLGPVALTVTSERGTIWEPGPRIDHGTLRYSIGGATLDRRIGPALLSLGVSRLGEAGSVLGGRFISAFGNGGATSWFADGGASVDLGGGWGAWASYRRGWTAMHGAGALVQDGRLASDAWSFDVARSSAFAPGDRLALRVMQPLRVASGGFDLQVPISYSYSDGSVGYESRFFSLAPTGREIDVEAAYGVGLWRGALSMNAFYRREPGHIAVADDDVGLAMRFNLDF